MYGKYLCNYILTYKHNQPYTVPWHGELSEVRGENQKRSDDDYYCQYVGYRNFNNPMHNLFYLGYDIAYPQLSIHNRTKSAIVFNCVLKGKGVFNGTPVKAGDCYYSRPNQLHSMYADKEDPWVSIWFSIDGIVGKQTCDMLDKTTTNQILSINKPEALKALTDFYLYELGEVNLTDDFVMCVFNQLLTFVKPDNAKNVEQDSVSPHLHPIINQSLLYIEDNIQTVTVKSLAAQAHLEVKYFTKIFTAIMSVSPQQYILKLKMNAAANTLANTDTSIEKISEMLGYQHRNGLSVAFRNAYGMSLTEYRKKHKK